LSAGATTRRPREEPLALVVEVGGGVVDRPRTKVNGDDDQDEDIRRTKRTTALIIVEAAVAVVVVVVVVAFVLLLRAVVVVVLVVDDFDSSDVVAVVRRLSSSSFMVCSPIFGFFGSCWIDRAIGVVVLFPARCHLGPIAALSWKLCFIPGPRLR
jgi:hypothetical protein